MDRKPIPGTSFKDGGQLRGRLLRIDAKLWILSDKEHRELVWLNRGVHIEPLHPRSARGIRRNICQAILGHGRKNVSGFLVLRLQNKISGSDRNSNYFWDLGLLTYFSSELIFCLKGARNVPGFDAKNSFRRGRAYFFESTLSSSQSRLGPGQRGIPSLL